MVCERCGTGQEADRGGEVRRDRDRSQDVGEDLLQLDGEHPAVVCQPPAVVGAPDPGMVRAGWRDFRGLFARRSGEIDSLALEGKAHAFGES